MKRTVTIQHGNLSVPDTAANRVVYTWARADDAATLDKRTAAVLELGECALASLKGRERPQINAFHSSPAEIANAALDADKAAT